VYKNLENNLKDILMKKNKTIKNWRIKRRINNMTANVSPNMSVLNPDITSNDDTNANFSPMND
jgi:hypothetical protein